MCQFMFTIVVIIVCQFSENVFNNAADPIQESYDSLIFIVYDINLLFKNESLYSHVPFVVDF